MTIDSFVFSLLDINFKKGIPLTSYYMLLLITPDKIFLKLIIDNKNVVKYATVYLDNTGIWVLSVIIDNIQMRSVPSDLLKNYSNLLGHRDVRTTMIYTHAVQSRKVNIADETANGVSLHDKSLDLSEFIFWKNAFSFKSDFCSIYFQ